MFRRINGWLEQFTGFRVSTATERSLPTDVVDDPRLAAYYDPGPGHGCAVFAPTAHGLSFNAFSLGSRSYHPWIVAVRAAEKSGEPGQVPGLLRTYYSLVQPPTLGDWLDIPRDARAQIDSLPLHAWSVLPWTTRHPADAIRAIETAQLQENRRHGLNEGMSAGAKAFGPVSEEKLHIEASRIGTLFASLRKSGLAHSRPDYDLRATILLAGDRWSWLSMGGMHRVAMAAAVGVTRIPFRVAAVVRREEAGIWPQVVSGLYGREIALELFDRLLARRPPACARPWIQWVDGQGILPELAD